jgi:hypothetical protein
VQTTDPNGGNSTNIGTLLLLVGLSIVGVMISGVVGTVLIYTYRTTRGR